MYVYLLCIKDTSESEHQRSYGKVASKVNIRNISDYQDHIQYYSVVKNIMDMKLGDIFSDWQLITGT